jgi:cyclohexa-1,5-dienecarbonyl-CoA hydratase
VSCSVRLNPDGTRAALTFAETPGNIFTADLISQMQTALEDLEDAPHLRLLTIEGAGADFSFGASVPEHTADAIGRVLPQMHALILQLLEIPAPTAAIVRGRCLGGGFELALACDFIFAADTATIGLPEIALGVFPPVASVLLPRRAGLARATTAILTGESVPATIWEGRGVIELTASESQLAAAVDDWYALNLARHSSEALRHAVRALRTPLIDVVRRELPAVERQYLDELMRSHDANEGVRAFMEKRQPQWQDE